MTFKVLTDYLPAGELIPSNPLRFTNSEGQQFDCYSLKEEEEDLSSVISESGMHALERFKQTCTMFSVGWWSYEWCYQKEVSQFHIEPRKVRETRRNPIWSLGIYEHNEILTDADGVISEVVEYFSGGQICHENDMQRSSEVHLTCCEKNMQETRRPIDIPADQIASLDRVVEPDLCYYEIHLCTPLLCPDVMFAELPHRVRNITLVEFMQKFKSTCLKRQEQWWSYDACFGPPKSMSQELVSRKKQKKSQKEKSELQEFTSGARQYRMTTVVSQSGKAVKHMQYIEAEFSLGVPPLEMYDNETALQEAVVQPRSHPIKRTTHALPSLQIEFTGGKACDIEDVTRGSTMEITCGSRDAIQDIIEDKTCHYVFKITSRAICAVPGFAPPQEMVSDLYCDPVDDEVGTVRETEDND
eukprot:CAMPEP_0185031628 /NCGR_PEP_ID=MMETSP1103-20130426/19204_1 /TAXON_ID=36769 /ORGANISM="Paraphysomonas bandaiensis, Strain Caron Lab Isolate" /LENGTH=413 /DNA_ID=CAMNT_0027567203 /DNA_START=239 /DNA_END=1480 /DNA_ORIENTATION=+